MNAAEGSGPGGGHGELEPRYHHRFSPLTDDRIESLFDDDEDFQVIDEDPSFVAIRLPRSNNVTGAGDAVVPIQVGNGDEEGDEANVIVNQGPASSVDGAKASLSSTERDRTSPSIKQNGESMTVPEEIKSDVGRERIHQEVQEGLKSLLLLDTFEKVESIKNENVVPGQVLDHHGDGAGMGSFLSISSSDSTTFTLEQANVTIAFLNKENTKLKELLTGRDDTIRNLMTLSAELKGQIEKSDIDTKNRLAETQKVIQMLKEENEKLEAEVQALGRGMQSSVAEKSKILMDQNTIIDLLKAENVQLKHKLQLKDAEILEAKAKLVSATEDSNIRAQEQEIEMQERVNAGAIVIEDLRKELTVLKLEKQILLDQLDKVKEEHQKIDKTRVALLKDAIEQKDLFRIQMEENRSSYEAERNDCVAIKEQRTLLQQELVKVKADLQLKVAELEKLHNNHLVLGNEHFNRGESAGASSFQSASNSTMGVAAASVSEGQSNRNGNPNPPSEDDDDMKCPICAKQFKRRETLINHAPNCYGKKVFEFP